MITENYFENIDNKEKAYWLGFLYADGNINTEKRRPKSYRLQVAVDKKDEQIIDSLIKSLNAFEKNKIFQEKMVRLCIRNKKLTKDLINHGIVPRKSKKIELPNFKRKEFYLAFLLGYFDGDGQQNTTKICSGSKIFLKQIKESFNLPFNITHNKDVSIIDQREIHGERYYLTLGAELFNEMMKNYKNSLPRKRRHFCTKEERVKRAIEASKKNTGKKKFEISKEQLKKLVWEIPSTKIAKMFGVSSKTIEKRCKKFGLKKPPRGYWAKKRVNKK